MLLGYDDLDRNDEEMVFKKYYRRIIKHTDSVKVKQLRDHHGVFMDKRNVFVFGHSLDLSDEDVLRPLLENNPTTVFYLDENDYAQKIKNLFLLLNKQQVLSKIISGSIRFERIEQI